MNIRMIKLPSEVARVTINVTNNGALSQRMAEHINGEFLVGNLPAFYINSERSSLFISQMGYEDASGGSVGWSSAEGDQIFVLLDKDVAGIKFLDSNGDEVQLNLLYMQFICNRCGHTHLRFFQTCICQPHCVECGSLMTDRNDDMLCQSCLRNIKWRGNYHPSMSLIYHDIGGTTGSQESGKVYFGVEIECNLKLSASVRRKKPIPNWMYGQRDGSLNDLNGVEITTHPATFEFLDANIKDAMSWDGWSGASEYGIHVHVSKHAFSNKSIAKIQVALSRYAAIVQKMGGRKYTRHCESPGRRNKEMIPHYASNVSQGKYYAVAVRDNTIEFRFFQTPLDGSAERIITNIRFVKTIVDWANGDDSVGFLDAIKASPFEDVIDLYKSVSRKKMEDVCVC